MKKSRIEELVLELITITRANSIELSGAIKLPTGDIRTFDNELYSNDECMGNIRSLMAAKGDISTFFCELSKSVDSVDSSETVIEANTYKATNPQVATTRH